MHGQTREKNEDFELNITEERITETNFERSTAVELNDNSQGNLTVKVGAGVSAEKIDVILRGIYGRVHFRASLAPILERIERLRLRRETDPDAPK